MTYDEVTAAMKAEDVDAALVEKAMWAVAGEQPACAECGENGPAACVYCKDDAEKYARHVIAAVLPEIQAQALRDAADRLHARTEGVNREGTKGWPERHREVYAHAIDEASDALREDAARLTDTTEEPTT